MEEEEQDIAAEVLRRLPRPPQFNRRIPNRAQGIDPGVQWPPTMFGEFPMDRVRGVIDPFIDLQTRNEVHAATTAQQRMDFIEGYDFLRTQWRVFTGSQLLRLFQQYQPDFNAYTVAQLDNIFRIAEMVHSEFGFSDVGANVGVIPRGFPIFSKDYVSRYVGSGGVNPAFEGFGGKIVTNESNNIANIVTQMHDVIGGDENANYFRLREAALSAKWDTNIEYMKNTNR